VRDQSLSRRGGVSQRLQSVLLKQLLWSIGLLALGAGCFALTGIIFFRVAGRANTLYVAILAFAFLMLVGVGVAARLSRRVAKP
jgi:hypothetical protein